MTFAYGVDPDETKPREVTFRFRYPSLKLFDKFAPLVRQAMREYIQACEAYVPHVDDAATPQPCLGFTASNGVFVERVWMEMNQCGGDELPEPTDEDLALLAAEEHAIATAKPNPARGGAQ